MSEKHPAHLGDTVKAESAAWLARLRADDRSPEDERAFHDWLGADPSHAVAFEAVSATWEASSRLARDLRGRDHGRTRPAHSRREMLAGVGALALGLGTFSILRSAQAHVFQTDIGEQKHVVLDDGSQVLLDTDTRIKVSFSKSLRAAELLYGRANFRVAADTARPFVVCAADRKIVTAASNLDVREDHGAMSVVLIEGSATLEPVIPGGRAEILHSGQQILADKKHTHRLAAPNIASLVAWQTGHAIFENERLADAVHEMNRYSTDTLQIESAGIAGMRVSGVYFVGDNVAFANAISKLLPVKIRRDGNHVYLSASTGHLTQG
jgi:transmembrane sensor